MNSKEELTVFVLRKEGHPKHVANGEAFRLIRPLFESNGLEVGEPIDLVDGFLFSIRPHSESWNDTERCAVMTGLSCLGSFGVPSISPRRRLRMGRRSTAVRLPSVLSHLLPSPPSPWAVPLPA